MGRACRGMLAGLQPLIYCSIGVAGGTQMVREKFGLALYLITEVLLQHRSDATVQFLPFCA